MQLNDHIQQLLGVVPPPPAPKTTPSVVSVGKSSWAPERPTPLFSFTISVSRTEYGSVSINAASASEAYDEAALDDVYWYDCGSADWGDAELDSHDPVNQNDLDEWDEEYGDRFDTDGQPKCSDCGDCFDDVSDLTPDPDCPTSRWLCKDCLPTA